MDAVTESVGIIQTPQEKPIQTFDEALQVLLKFKSPYKKHPQERPGGLKRLSEDYGGACRAITFIAKAFGQESMKIAPDGSPVTLYRYVLPLREIAARLEVTVDGSMLHIVGRGFANQVYQGVKEYELVAPSNGDFMQYEGNSISPWVAYSAFAGGEPGHDAPGDMFQLHKSSWHRQEAEGYAKVFYSLARQIRRNIHRPVETQ